MDLKELESGVNPSVHWYYQSKKVPLFKYFKKLHATQGKKINVIDFGSGSGFFAYELLEAFPQAIDRVFLVDIGYSEEEMAATRGQQVEKVHFIPEGIEDSVVVMMDVLEHIEDDYAILEDIKKRLGQNAHYFITVPAFMSLWSGHDVFLEHYRRYTIEMMEKTIRDAGLTPVKSRYFFGLLFPFVIIIRFVKKTLVKQGALKEKSELKLYPAWFNSFLVFMHKIERHTIFKFNKLFGLSVFCICEKK